MRREVACDPQSLPRLLFKTLKVTLRLVKTASGSITQDQSPNTSDQYQVQIPHCEESVTQFQVRDFWKLCHRVFVIISREEYLKIFAGLIQFPRPQEIKTDEQHQDAGHIQTIDSSRRAIDPTSGNNLIPEII